MIIDVNSSGDFAWLRAVAASRAAVKSSVADVMLAPLSSYFVNSVIFKFLILSINKFKCIISLFYEAH